ncbi:MAG: FHA domain-containing protein [Acidobacteria bacterium]|nr:FHA domain-containing protein [Acidobacteriota bacterium]MBI3421565.1 FHA domain-containing protein [Acidobacteriota bacterium]
MASLRVIQPDQRSFVYRISLSEIGIGRELDNHLVLQDDARVSRRHAQIRQRDGEGYVFDLGSGNGTYVNDRRIPAQLEVPLKDGDVLRIGSHQLAYVGDTKPKSEIIGDGFRQVAAKVPSDVIGFSPLASASDSQDVPALLYRRELEKKGRILKLFYELSSKLSAVFQLDEVYGKVLDILFEVTPASRAFIYRRSVNAETGKERFDQVAVRLRSGSQDKAADSKPLPISKSVFAKVANERVSILLDDTLRTFTSESIVINQIHSVMAAPIVGEEGLLGIIYADRQDDEEAFTPDDLDLLNAVAVQTGIAISTVLNHESLQRELQTRARLERFLPQPAVEEILRSPDKVKLGGTRQQITALFADVRGFTPLTERSTPEVIVTLLNRYFSLASEIIFKHGGTLDKYIGDSLMALFGAPYESEQQATQAVRAAIELQRSMPAFNAGLQRDGLPTVAIGIGINTGQAIVGYVGSETRLDYTAIGDAVNTAARLESQAKPGQIIVSEHTLNVLDKGFTHRPLGTTKLKGKLIDLRLAEIVWDNEA